MSDRRSSADVCASFEDAARELGSAMVALQADRPEAVRAVGRLATDYATLERRGEQECLRPLLRSDDPGVALHAAKYFVLHDECAGMRTLEHLAAGSPLARQARGYLMWWERGWLHVGHPVQWEKAKRSKR